MERIEGFFYNFNWSTSWRIAASVSGLLLIAAAFANRAASAIREARNLSPGDLREPGVWVSKLIDGNLTTGFLALGMVFAVTSVVFYVFSRQFRS